MKFKVGDKIKFKKGLPTDHIRQLLDHPKTREVFEKELSGIILQVYKSQLYTDFKKNIFTVYDDEVELVEKHNPGHPLTKIFRDDWVNNIPIHTPTPLKVKTTDNSPSAYKFCQTDIVEIEKILEELNRPALS